MSLNYMIYPNFTVISDNFDAILLDAYGVFWGGNDFGLLSGSKEMMELLVSSGKIVGVLSNSTQPSAKEIAKFQRHDLIPGKHFHFLITSGDVARHILQNQELPFKTPNSQFWVFGKPHPKFSSHTAMFDHTVYQETQNIDEADFIFIAIPHIDGEDQIDPNLFRPALEKILDKKLPMVCANPDQFAHEGSPPRAVVRQGTIAKMFEEMGGQVFYIGKPHKKVYTVSLSQFEMHQVSDPRKILMVGDTPETDIRGANTFGMPSALVIQTGIAGDRVAHHGLDNVLSSLPVTDFPTFLINKFA